MAAVCTSYRQDIPHVQDHKVFTGHLSSGIKLEREDYFTSPSLEVLSLDLNGQCIVDSFIVGRQGYGTVTFEGPLDVADLDLDQIVFFRHKEVTVYPDDSRKPPRGQGLNRPAVIALHRVWPLHTACRAFATDNESLRRYRQMLKQVTEDMEGTFIDYHPHSGTWIFRVEHFTKYGLDESDEENDLPIMLNLLPKTPQVAQATPPQKVASNAAQFTGLSGIPARPRDLSSYEPYPMATEEDMGAEEDISLQQHYKAAAVDETAASPPPASVQLARALGMPSQRVQIMKASLFDTQDLTMETWEAADYPVPSATPSFGRILKPSALIPNVPAEQAKLSSLKLFRSANVPADKLETSLMETSLKPVMEYDPFASYTRLEPSMVETEKPLKIIPKFALAEFPLEESIMSGKNDIIADAALFHGRRFRLGWGPDWMMTSLSAEESYALKIQQVAPLMRNKEDEDEFTEMSSNVCTALLATYLKYGTEKKKFQTLPQFSPANGTNGLEELRKTTLRLKEKSTGLQKNQLEYMLQVWDLCFALWGPLQDEFAEGSHAEIMARREALSLWLQSTSERKTTKLNTLDQILENLSSREIAEATKAAQAAGDHRLAMLLSQAGSSPVFKNMLQRQLQQWAESKADQFINKSRMKIFSTLAGMPVWPSSKLTINTCEDRDWLAAFAHHLWYKCSPVASIADALVEYEKACGILQDLEPYAAQPNPLYTVSGDQSSGSWDLRYQLLQLYCRRSTPLESVLNPFSHTSDLLDTTLSWLLWQQLQSIGYSHLSDTAAALLNTSFAAQLEQIGLWHWSLLVLMHSRGSNKSIDDVIGRHIQMESSDPKEVFIRERLELPVHLIESHRAIRARSLDLPLQEAKSLLMASQFQMAHDVIFEKLAPEAILAEDYQGLQDLLNGLAGLDRAALIDQWTTKGKVLVDYIKMVKTVEDLLGKVRQAEKLEKPNSENMIQLEQLTPDLLSLSSQIPSLSTPTPKHKLCKAEIAQRTSYILRVIIGLQSGSAADNAVVPSRLLLPQLQQLPVTQDYALKELRSLVRSFLLELNV